MQHSANDKHNRFQKYKPLANQLTLLLRNSLENIGSHIDIIKRKRNKTLTYRPINEITSKTSLAETSNLHQYLLKNTNSLKKLPLLKNDLLKSTISDKAIEELIETLLTGSLTKLAAVAESWSKKDVIGESRFADLDKLSNDERHNLAHQVANQNRALATLGGATGLFGLPAIIVDSLWMLLVSLRTVYQLAHIYGQPLTGTAGLQTAYAVLDGCELDNITSKHTLLIGMGLTSRVLKNTEKQGLQQALIKELKTDEGVAAFIEHLEIALKKSPINNKAFVLLPKLGKSLPVLSALGNAHFNSLIIEEVIGTAQASFAPEIKVVSINQ